MYARDNLGTPYRTTDGIEWQLERIVHTATYPYRHNRVDFYGRPTAAGQQSNAYQARKSQLGDDWSRCLTDSPYLIDTMLQAHMTEDQITAVLDDSHSLRMQRLESVDLARRTRRN